MSGILDPRILPFRICAGWRSGKFGAGLRRGIFTYKEEKGKLDDLVPEGTEWQL
jgi:hypothetical protein